MNLYDVLALATLLYSLGCWTIKAETKSMVVAAEMKFTKKSCGYNWKNYKTDTEILNECRCDRENNCV